MSDKDGLEVKRFACLELATKQGLQGHAAVKAADAYLKFIEGKEVG